MAIGFNRSSRTFKRWAVVAYIKALQLSQNAKPGDEAPGAQVESLSDIAAAEGLTPKETEWKLPATAVYGTPNNQDNGIPQEIGAPSKTPAAKPGAPAATNTQ